MYMKVQSSKAMLNDSVSQCHHQNALLDFSHPMIQGRISSFPTGWAIIHGCPSSLYS